MVSPGCANRDGLTNFTPIETTDTRLDTPKLRGGVFHTIDEFANQIKLGGVLSYNEGGSKKG